MEVYSEWLATHDTRVEDFHPARKLWGRPVSPMPMYEVGDWLFMSPELTRKYPLYVILGPHSVYRWHSHNDDNTALNTDVYRHACWMNVADAKARDIKDGDLIRIYNDIGELVIPAYVTNRIVPGTTAIFAGGWAMYNAAGIDRRGGANVLAHDDWIDEGMQKNSLCEIEKFEVEKF